MTGNIKRKHSEAFANIIVMTDVHDSKTRSFNMSRVRHKDTKPELIVRKSSFSHGLRYRLNDSKLLGKPDIVFGNMKTVIFVHGCFWHAHENCRYFRLPKTNTEWWRKKRYTNRNRDVENIKGLEADGWKTHVLFECELRRLIRENTLKQLLDSLNQT